MHKSPQGQCLTAVPPARRKLPAHMTCMHTGSWSMNGLGGTLLLASGRSTRRKVSVHMTCMQDHMADKRSGRHLTANVWARVLAHMTCKQDHMVDKRSGRHLTAGVWASRTQESLAETQLLLLVGRHNAHLTSTQLGAASLTAKSECHQLYVQRCRQISLRLCRISMPNSSQAGKKHTETRRIPVGLQDCPKLVKV